MSTLCRQRASPTSTHPAILLVSCRRRFSATYSQQPYSTTVRTSPKQPTPNEYYSAIIVCYYTTLLLLLYSTNYQSTRHNILIVVVLRHEFMNVETAWSVVQTFSSITVLLFVASQRRPEKQSTLSAFAAATMILILLQYNSSTTVHTVKQQAGSLGNGSRSLHTLETNNNRRRCRDATSVGINQASARNGPMGPRHTVHDTIQVFIRSRFFSGSISRGYRIPRT